LKNRIYADTNLFIRLFTNSPPEQAEKSKIFLRQVVSGNYELFVCDLIIAEIVYVLDSLYSLNRREIVEKIIAIAEIDNTVLENRLIILSALNLYEKNNIDFVDAYLASHAKKNGCDQIVTFDKDFKKLDFIKQINPE